MYIPNLMMAMLLDEKHLEKSECFYYVLLSLH